MITRLFALFAAFVLAATLLVSPQPASAQPEINPPTATTSKETV